MPKIEKIEGFNQALKALTGRNWRSVVNKEITKAVKVAAEVVRRNIVKSLKSGRPEWPPIHPYTKAIREFRGAHGSLPLNETGALSRNITVLVQGVDAVIGVLRTAPRRGSAELANVARLQERGYTIRVTPKMRAFFKARGLRLKFTTTHLRVPARPFMQPAVQESADQIKTIFLSAVAQILANVTVRR